MNHEHVAELKKLLKKRKESGDESKIAFKRKNLSEVVFESDDLCDIDFRISNFSECWFQKLETVNKVCFDYCMMQRAVFDQVVISNCSFISTGFYKAKLSDVTFENCVFKAVDFSNAQLGNITFRNCKLQNLSFDEPEFMEAIRFDHSDFFWDAFRS